MKILLAACNAKYIHSNLAVFNLKACAKEYDSNVVLREYTINQQKDDILKDIYRCHPDVICISCYIWNITFVRELMQDLRKILPDVPFWAGGPEVSYDAEEFLKKNPAFDGVMVGEGEETFLELVKHYVNGSPSLEETTGLVYCKPDGTIQNNGWRQIMDLSRVPFAYEDLKDFENRIIYYESSRGCPFSCSYCLSSVDKKLRFRDLELVKKELQFFLDHKVPQVKFVDRTFNCKHDHAMTIWQYIKDHDNGITNFHFEISADLLRENELELMSTMRPGLIQLEIGVQSTNPDTIRAIHRTMDFPKLAGIVKRIHSFKNIHQHLDLIAGLPYEDYDSFHRSFNDVYALRPQQLQLGFLKVLKGSHMKEMTEEYGIVHIHVKDMPSYAYVLHEVACLHTPYFHTSLTGKSCEALTLYPQDFPITIRNVQEGDAIVLRLGRKKVHRWFIDRKIPSWERKCWPVVVNAQGNVILVPQIGCDIAHFSNNPSIFVVK